MKDFCSIKKICRLLLFILPICLLACHPRLESALEQAGDNRAELEKVLEHFKNDPDTLKYSAAVFLIENMACHYTQEGKGMDVADSAYLAMAEYPKEQREKVFRELMKDVDVSADRMVVDLRSMKADYLIKAIDEACEVWHEVSWNDNYDTSLFFDYVLPYRLLDEPLSDWRQTIGCLFPSLRSVSVLSKRGMHQEAEALELMGCSVSDDLGASDGKCVVLDREGAAVVMEVNVPSDCRKNMLLQYAAKAKNSELGVKVNGRWVDTLRLAPTADAKSFRLNRRECVLNLKAGTNRVCFSCVGDTINLDYVQVGSVENYDEQRLADYSQSYVAIKNVQNGKYITFDTLQTAILNRLELKPLQKGDSTQMVRMNFLGHGCWSVSAFKQDSIDLCMEVYYAKNLAGTPVSQYKYIDGNHQKWVVLPAGDGMSKIMSKDSGLFLDAEHDESTDKTFLVLNPYTGAKSQHWMIEQRGTTPWVHPKFALGSSLSEALRVHEQMGQFEWVYFSTGLAPKGSSLFKALTGNCRDEASFTVLLCRFLGIPSTIDFTPHWGNRSWGHHWSVLIQPDGKHVPFYMGSLPGDTTQFFHPYQKAKVFRHRFQLNRQVVNAMKGEKYVPLLFQMPDWIDVTDEYCPVTDVTRKVPEKYRDRKVAYICVFDNNDWLPIYYGVVSGGKVTFPGMGRNLMYVSAFYEGGRLVPFGTPFCIKDDGTVRDVKADMKNKCTLNLARKYPFFAEKESFNSRMKQGRFQGSNDRDFSVAKDLYVFDEVTNGNWYDVPIHETSKYRYLRYLSPDGSYGNINELCFFDEHGDTIKGKVIGSEGKEAKGRETVFDNNILTGFEGTSPDGNWVGLQLKHPTQVSKLRFIPRTDGNCIEIGDKYELRLWTGSGWRVLAMVRAKSDILRLRNMPSKGLYVLRDMTKGQEQRIFTYEGGKQVWW